MQVSDFHFELPDELIARYPKAERTASRLLQLDGNSGQLVDGTFKDVLELVEPGDLLVFNNTRVIPARMFGRKASGGKLEVLVERMLDEHTILAHVRSSKPPKPGTELYLGENDEFHAVMQARHDALFEIRFTAETVVLDILNQIGHMPLPPYIDRPDEEADKERYQTVYNQKPGAVAAPTAGLHFDQALLEQIQAKGVELAYVTLHVGAGTSSLCGWKIFTITICMRNTLKCHKKWWMRLRRPKHVVVEWLLWVPPQYVHSKVRRKMRCKKAPS